MQAQNLQLAISANATVKSLLLDRENDAMQRLQEVSQHLSELIDNLETEFLNRTKDSPLSTEPLGQSIGNVGHSELVAESQREYMRATIELLQKKDEAIERMTNEHNKIMREVILAHEETIRRFSQGREETTRAVANKWLERSEKKE